MPHRRTDRRDGARGAADGHRGRRRRPAIRVQGRAPRAVGGSGPDADPPRPGPATRSRSQRSSAVARGRQHRSGGSPRRSVRCRLQHRGVNPTRGLPVRRRGAGARFAAAVDPRTDCSSRRARRRLRESGARRWVRTAVVTRRRGSSCRSASASPGTGRRDAGIDRADPPPIGGRRGRRRRAPGGGRGGRAIAARSTSFTGVTSTRCTPASRA